MVAKLTQWNCPTCGNDLLEVGAFEVQENVTVWTQWKRDGERWDIKDEEASDGNGWYLECGQCQATLPSEMATAFWDEMQSVS